MDTDLYPIPPPSILNRIYFFGIADVLDPYGEREAPKRVSLWTDGYETGVLRIAITGVLSGSPATTS